MPFSSYRTELLTQFFEQEAQDGGVSTGKVKEFAKRGQVDCDVDDSKESYSKEDFLAAFDPLNGVSVGEFHRRLGAMEQQHDFLTLRYNLSPECIEMLADEVIGETKTVNDKVAALEGEYTFENVIAPLAKATQEIEEVVSSVWFAKDVHQDSACRDASTEASKKMQKANVEESMRLDVYEKVKGYYESDKKEQLTPEQDRMVKRWIRDYKRLGIHLDEEKRNRIKEIKTRMSELSITFAKNTAEENTLLKFTREELDGVPQDLIDGLPKEEEKIVCSLKYPVYFPIMDNCKVISTRQQMEKAFSSRCMEENVPILEELVRLRHEKAQILDFPTHAAFVLDVRMAKNPEAVMKFENDLSEKLTPLLDSDLAALKALKQEELGDASDGKINPYDSRYYNKMRVVREYTVDDEKVKEYFPLQTVLDGMFDIYQGLLGLKFNEVDVKDATKKWHPEISLYQVNDAQDDRLVGYFYLDIHPRPGKYGHAAAFTLRGGSDIINSEGVKTERMFPVSAMVANFSAPTENQPSLLRHDEVVTLFHEFGHIMHQICAENVAYAEFHGTSVERDFVEAPSQMLENWCWEKEPILKMCGHYKTGEPIPDDLLEKLVKAKNANAGILNKRQLLFGIFDQRLHSGPEADTLKLLKECSEEICKITPTPGTNFCGSFGHLAGGYDAAYYGYMWSEVFAADMFYSRFKKEGLLNPKTGASYREHILANGGSLDADEMLRRFLGRDPTMDAFLLDKGLQVAPKL